MNFKKQFSVYKQNSPQILVLDIPLNTQYFYFMSEKKHRGHFIRFLSYVKPYWLYVVLGAVGGVVKFTLPLFVPRLIQFLVDNVFQNPDLAMSEKITQLLYYIMLMIGAYLFIWAPFTYIRHYFAGKAGHKSVFDLRCGLYYHILRMSNAFFNTNQSGGIVSRLINDVALAQNLVGSALTNIWIDGSAIFVILYFLLKIDVPTALVALAMFPLYILYFKRIGSKLKDNSYLVQKNIEEMSGNLQEKIAGSTVVKIFTKERDEELLFNNQSEKLLSTTMRSVKLQSVNMMISGIFTGLPPLLVLLAGGYRVIHGDLTLGGLIAINLYLAPLYFPLQRFSELNVIFSNAMAALERIFEVMDKKPEITDFPGAVNAGKIRGDVEFRNVNFEYAQNKAVLRNLSFSVKAGTRTALVGRSGSGKSTLIALIPRLYDITGGQICIDGTDVRDFKLASLRSHISVVLQDPVLFSGTVRDNILYGNAKATNDDVVHACRMAHAYDFIMALPAKLDTEVGERGVMLSGGQKQRLTIARAFLKNPEILILDEATSSLDSESEKLIQDALFKLIAGRTTFIIAHRLSTIIDSDVILVLDNGQIAESGNHQTLLAHNGLYRQYYDKQFRFDI